MPLVVPGITQTNSADKTTEWTNKLVGKKIEDSDHSETVFCKRDLPEKCRVIQPGQVVTMDYVEDRLNVKVAEDGTVATVYHG
ncbi:hypothetical protein GGTG_06505 [Gaeumannomyces tritici R3-111a-1]|uniref:Proteinase inhibitor I78 n=1 Tax=Gaeumannomyces tritici (strain R3-111a-1) TaxID=644352 RepID=J3NZ05_GAET3|nr:hypothetical protein GGTG_06505 [Gaeumannomyces tritici R3-111a-1]EJT76588.1 hypothetical protein GGTG_06505 [Gaeumannomyces tritici R3-111a-1]